MSLKKAIRHRPVMFIGGEGMIGLFQQLISSCIKLIDPIEICFEIDLLENNLFQLRVTTQQNLTNFIKAFTSKTHNSENLSPRVLKLISKHFEMRSIAAFRTEIEFSIDEAVNISTEIDYLKLHAKLVTVALLNRNSKITVKDLRTTHLNQNYYHFPQGIFYLFDGAVEEALGKPKFIIKLDDEIETYKFQIGIAFRSDWYPTPLIVSFANDTHTVCGGSLIDGILDGLVDGIKKYIKEKDVEGCKVNRKNLYNGLILYAAVRGEDFIYGGSWRETLQDDRIRKIAKQLIAEKVLDLLLRDTDLADNILDRFDPMRIVKRITESNT